MTNCAGAEHHRTGCGPEQGSAGPSSRARRRTSTTSSRRYCGPQGLRRPRVWVRDALKEREVRIHVAIVVAVPQRRLVQGLLIPHKVTDRVAVAAAVDRLDELEPASHPAWQRSQRTRRPRLETVLARGRARASSSSSKTSRASAIGSATGTCGDGKRLRSGSAGLAAALPYNAASLLCPSVRPSAARLRAGARHTAGAAVRSARWFVRGRSSGW